MLSLNQPANQTGQQNQGKSHQKLSTSAVICIVASVTNADIASLILSSADGLVLLGGLVPAAANHHIIIWRYYTRG